MVLKTTQIGSLAIALTLSFSLHVAQAEGWKSTGGNVSESRKSDNQTTSSTKFESGVGSKSGEPARLHVDPKVRPAAGSLAEESAGPSSTGPSSTGPSSKGALRTGFTLPREAGQIWQEYDLSNYTLRVTTTARPEQAVVDWILRETGYEMWHSQPLGILSATPRKLRVYHTPEVQNVINKIVKRFTGPASESRSFSLRAVTVHQPNWRVKAQAVLNPVQTQTPGIQAWVLRREDASLLTSELRRRSDFREHSSPHLTVPNGQSTVVSNRTPRSYIRNVAYQTGAWTGYRQDSGQIDEGFSFEFSPLLDFDGQMIDAVIKCSITKIDKMLPVAINLPATAASSGAAKVEVPQLSQFRLHERFRWPTEQVLLIDMGMVAIPNTGSTQLIPGIPLLSYGSDRVNLLVFIESRPTTSQTVSSAPAYSSGVSAAQSSAARPTAAGRYGAYQQATRPAAPSYHGRY